MTDIVDDLRAQGSNNFNYDDKLMLRAAAEIERLRQERDDFALAIVEGDEAFTGVAWEDILVKAEKIVRAGLPASPTHSPSGEGEVMR